MPTDVVGRAGFARRAAAAILADPDALARYEVCDLDVPGDVALALEAMLKRGREFHRASDVTFLRGTDA